MSQPPSPDPPDPDRPASPWEEPTAGPEPPPSHRADPNQPPEHGEAQGGQPQWGQQQWEQQQQWGQQQPQWEQQQQQWGQQHHLYGAPKSPATNVLAVLSLVFAFVFAPAGIVLGHLARRQLRTSGESGGQLATVGLILSYIFTAFILLACCGWAVLATISGNDSTY
ncbi:DUF4190 domain-containing protein [Salinispora oceanensis]|uniref:DUF4190 domain-containing protein n=1 Tax=Salinispora oceanensis TaxID=1050199 RepID=UPI00035F54E7|nr:DUF4190 domain-containing protein [Salinispora oceanensis]